MHTTVALLLIVLFVKSVSQSVERDNSGATMLDRLICATGKNNTTGGFDVTACNRYPKARLFPFCVYVVEPAQEKKSSKAHYGCIYAHDLPGKCSQLEEYYYPSVTVRLNGKIITGSLMCCMDDYCNEVEDPTFSQVRMVETGDSELKNALPYLIILLLITISVIPLMSSHLEERRKESLKRAEKAPWIDQMPNALPLLEVNKYYTISPNFSSLRKLNDTLRNFNQAYKFPVNETIEDQEANMFLEVHVTQMDNNVTRMVKRRVQTKLSSLAMKMVEHGPYEFEFDPTEVGDLFDSVSQLLAREPSLLQLASDVWIYGNLDGNYSTVYRWLHSNGWPPKRKVLFLGGYTADGQYYSLETITLLFALKKQMPNHVYLLRGASEVYPIHIEGRFSRRVTRCLEGVIQRACGYLPLAATVADTILCCHGGITPRLTKLSEITDIRRPIHHIKKGTIAADLIFSVISKTTGLIPGARGHRFNPMVDETEFLLKALGMEMLIRSRNPVKQGYQSFGARTISIWSAPGESNCKAGSAIHVNCSKVLTIVKMGEYGTFTKEQTANASKQPHDRGADALLPMNKDRERRKKKAAKKEGGKRSSDNRET
nr:serine/threonine protein phosphatase [Haemonchus contortus]